MTPCDVVNSPELAAAFVAYLRDLTREGTVGRNSRCRGISRLTHLSEGRIREAQYIRAISAISTAKTLFEKKIYDGAHSAYLKAIDYIIGRDHTIPLTITQSGGIVSDAYTRLSMNNRTNLMTCCNGIAKSLVEEDREEEVRSQDNELIGFDWCTNISQALEWFEEVDVLYKNARFGTRPPLFGGSHQYLMTFTFQWANPFQIGSTTTRSLLT